MFAEVVGIAGVSRGTSLGGNPMRCFYTVDSNQSRTVLLRFRLAFAWSTAATFLFVTPVAAQARKPCSEQATIDLHAGTFAGVPLDSSVAYLRQHPGPIVITRVERKLGGERWMQYVYAVCGHRLDRLDHGVRWTDPAIRTTECLGVGSLVTAFDSVYGIGVITREEGTAVHYTRKGVGFWVDLPDRCFTYFDNGVRVEVDRRCKAVAIYAVL